MRRVGRHTEIRQKVKVFSYTVYIIIPGGGCGL